jgi:hypothetical protein
LLIVLAVLAVATAVTWMTVLIKTGAAAGVTACPLPTAGLLPARCCRRAWRRPPVPPSTVKVRVLNAGGQRGQANLVAAQFGDFGFAQAAPPTNDKFFPGGDMTCRAAALRTGRQGAASTVALLVPCAELVRDGRADDTVDVAVGTAFGDLNPGRAVRDALTSSARPGRDDRLRQRRPAAGNAPPPATPVVEAATLATAREATCG